MRRRRSATGPSEVVGAPCVVALLPQIFETPWIRRARLRVTTSMGGVRSMSVALTLAMLAAMPMPVTAGYVRGYMRKDGTYVAPRYQNPPGFGGTHDGHATTAPPRSHSSGTRDPEERRAFIRTHPCPSTGKTSAACPGYVVGHTVPLNRGGADVPYNMQWQPIDAAKAKRAPE